MFSEKPAIADINKGYSSVSQFSARTRNALKIGRTVLPLGRQDHTQENVASLGSPFRFEGTIQKQLQSVDKWV